MQKSFRPVTVIFLQSFDPSHIWLISSWIFNLNIPTKTTVIPRRRKNKKLIYYVTCQFCSVKAITQGVNMRPNGKLKLSKQRRKLIYKKIGLWYLSPIREGDSMKKLSVICQKFRTSITSDKDHQKFPMFS